MNMIEFLEFINPAVWVLTNVILLYISIALTGFVISYQVFFDPKSTTGGRMIFRFALSLLLVIFVVGIGIFVDPRLQISWNTLPPDVIWWRPVVRLFAYGYVAYTITALSVFLWKRKFRPESLKTAPDKLLVKPRHDTDEIKTIKEINS
jgi:hypothetical protein